jgi:hypothetical protein
MIATTARKDNIACTAPLTCTADQSISSSWFSSNDLRIAGADIVDGYIKASGVSHIVLYGTHADHLRPCRRYQQLLAIPFSQLGTKGISSTPRNSPPTACRNTL